MVHDAHDNPFRHLPSVNRLVDEIGAGMRWEGLPRSRIVAAARAEIDDRRRSIRRGDDSVGSCSMERLVRGASERLEHGERPPLGPVINATGIIIHTGLGRAPLAVSAVRALVDVAGGYAPVELEMDSGQRGDRSRVVRGLLCELTGAESALVVNNNAAALLLALAAIARGRGVVVSRGELIEIGGSFRLPEVMEAGGAVLREVGTTNKTRLADYDRAIDESTAALLKVHTSNYRIEGFTESVSIAELVELGRRRGVPVIDDVGSGALVDLATHGLGAEPSVRAAVAAGADLVLFSGDKVLGGPQAGIIVGRGSWIEQLTRHPMMRALRVDKLTLAALGATLQLHRDQDHADEAVPVLRMARASVAELRRRAERLAESWRGQEGVAEASVESATAYFGGGALPAQGVPSVAIRVRSSNGNEPELARRLRLGEPSVVPRVQDGAVWIDLRTVFPEQDESLRDAVLAACQKS